MSQISQKSLENHKKKGSPESNNTSKDSKSTKIKNTNDINENKNETKTKETSLKELRRNVFAFCAHSDDQILGAGGTLAKLSEEGYDIYVIILSHGANANPLTKTKFTVKTRRDESLKANEIIQAKDLFYFNLSEGKFLLEYKLTDTFSKLVKIFREYKPVKIFTHAPDDVHIDHRNTLAILLDIITRIDEDYKPDVFSFDVWNFFNLKSNSYPVVYINISKQIRKKSQAISCFKSQKISMISLLAKIYIEMIFNGIRIGTFFAEKFYKVM